jgi:hypothetical protein
VVDGDGTTDEDPSKRALLKPNPDDREPRLWGHLETGIGAAFGEEWPGFGVGTGAAWELGVRVGLPTETPLELGINFRGIVPENRLFLTDPAGGLQRLISSEIGSDTLAYLRWTSKPARLRFWVQPGLALPFWEIHRTASTVGVFQELGGWFGVWLGGHVSGGLSWNTPKWQAGFSTGLTVGGQVADSEGRFGFGPWFTATPLLIWWRGPVFHFDFDLRYFPSVRVELAPVELLAFVDPSEQFGSQVPDRFMHFSLKVVLQLPFGPQPPAYDLR